MERHHRGPSLDELDEEANIGKTKSVLQDDRSL